MAGEGYMAHAILTLKQNRALLKKRNLKDFRTLLYEQAGKTELEFKEVSTLELHLIKSEIRRKAKKAFRIEILIYLISILLSLIFVYLIYRFLFG
ncbi:MAG: hypothetical protein WA810_07020 [Maribacter sp.]